MRWKRSDESSRKRSGNFKGKPILDRNEFDNKYVEYFYVLPLIDIFIDNYTDQLLKKGVIETNDFCIYLQLNSRDSNFLESQIIWFLRGGTRSISAPRKI